MFFKILISQAKRICKLEGDLSRQKREQEKKQEIIDFLYKEISRRDQKIIEQQKRLRFFGIEIGNEDYEAEKLDFPSTIKSKERSLYAGPGISRKGTANAF